MAYRPLAIGGQIASLGAPEDILAQAIAARQAKDAMAQNAQERRKGEIDLAKAALDQKELERMTSEDTQRRGVMGSYAPRYAVAGPLPKSISGPELPVEQVNKEVGIDLAKINPDIADKFNAGIQAETQSAEDRTRAIAFKDAAERRAEDANTRAERDQKLQETAERNRQYLSRLNRGNGSGTGSTGTGSTGDGGTGGAARAKQLDPAKAAKLRESKAGAVSELDATADVIDRLIGNEYKGIKGHPGFEGLTGSSGVLPAWTDTPKVKFLGISGNTRDAEALRQQLIAKSAFAELQKMRVNSPTGGALGQVSDKEGQMLQNAAAALQRGQSPEQFRNNLENFRAQLRRSKKNIEAAYSREMGEPLPDYGNKNPTEDVNEGDWK